MNHEAYSIAEILIERTRESLCKHEQRQLYKTSNTFARFANSHGLMYVRLLEIIQAAIGGASTTTPSRLTMPKQAYFKSIQNKRSITVVFMCGY